MSSLAAALSSMVVLSSMAELIEDHMDTVATNGVYWGTRSMLVATLSHFSEIGTELELLMSGRNMDLTEDLVDALWTQAHLASDLLASFILSSVARGSPNGTGEE
jgi:hypothetical protein